MTPPTLEEAIEVIKEYPDKESYIDAYYAQWMASGLGMDDNSIDLNWYWNQCNALLSKPAPGGSGPL